MDLRKAAVLILAMAAAMGLTATAFADAISTEELVAQELGAFLPWLLVMAVVAVTLLLLRRRKK